MVDMQDLQPGAIVYEPRRPSLYGKVSERQEEREPWQSEDGPPSVFYVVKWKDGRTTREWSLQINSLENLIADHEKKLATHRATMKKAMEL